MNNVTLIGRLTRDPELSYTPNTQTAVCKFDIAVNRPRRQNEERRADFLHINVFGRQAENCDKYLAKGRQVGVHGRIETGSYINRDGVKVNTFDIVADNVEFLGVMQTDRQVEERIIEEREEPIYNTFNDLPDSFSASEDDIPF